ncbi:NrfD/PsrC family molybdoenzyme membrane anchor subunit [Dyella sp.]|uniref:NrfD/PsrC family molybdoenzyme membrane anchor subunit n=1 Tax=Dyella sp. TaxID=1869338 RepID=UPI002D76F72F|nr:NrfD/PsrC family molybdoenzyme membrane anchor subunit [Dyella sp.]HET6432792.1 NrfD/PsrC family molybdoenzyme membrane anchor subunit [Dyella sp.]
MSAARAAGETRATLDPGASPVIDPHATMAGLTAHTSDAVLERPIGALWLGCFAGALLLTGLLAAGIWRLLLKGVGIWGINIPVAWAFAITNYVWWIAIGMGGTFISAALYLARQPWRASLNRFAESMTVCAVSVSGIFPILHLGRPWFFYWLMPYPNRMDVWPQWRSSLLWDFFAIVAYLLVSLMYWYVGLVPDFATLRDRARQRWKQVSYGVLALGWRGDAQHWRHYERVSLVLAGLSVPLVFSVHSMVALDFSEGLLPGWHSTLFPPFFIAGALFSGFAMALVLGIALRRWYRMEAYITERHLDNLAKMMLAAGLVVGYSYATELFTAFYSMDTYELAEAKDRLSGAYSWMFWLIVGCNVVSIQTLWWPQVRRNRVALVVISILVLIGMWFERLLLILNSLYHGFLPSSWGMFYPTLWDLAFLAGSFGMFFLLLLILLRCVPMLSMFELRKLIHQRGGATR